MRRIPFQFKFNQEFISKNPNIFTFIDVLLAQQMDTYTKMNAANKRKSNSREQKEQVLEYYIKKYNRGELSRLQYVQKISMKFLPAKLNLI